MRATLSSASDAPTICGGRPCGDRFPRDCAWRADCAEEECGLRKHTGFQDRGLMTGDVAQLGEREMRVVGDAVGERVCVDVGGPEDEGGDGDEDRNASRGVRERLGADDDDGEHENRSVDEAPEAFTHARAVGNAPHPG